MNLEVPTFHGPPCSRRGKVCSTLKLRFADGGIEMFHHVTITWVFTNIQNSIRKLLGRIQLYTVEIGGLTTNSP